MSVLSPAQISLTKVNTAFASEWPSAIFYGIGIKIMLYNAGIAFFIIQPIMICLFNFRLTRRDRLNLKTFTRSAASITY